MPRTAVIAGATGLVGSHCLRYLTASPEYARVIALVRRKSAAGSGGAEERVVDFDHLDTETFEAGADVFCALGTTIRKAGSEAAFRRVDFEYPVALAKRAAALDARQFLVVSSVSANAASSNFYLKTKGEMERDLASLAFDAVHIFRPSFLIGDRPESRPGEKIGILLARALGFVMVGPLANYHAIPAQTVAAAMVRAALQNGRGVHVHHYAEMRRLAGDT